MARDIVRHILAQLLANPAHAGQSQSITLPVSMGSSLRPEFQPLEWLV